MRQALGLALIVAGTAALAHAQAAPERTPAATTPYKAAPSDPLDFRGPGREEPEPDVAEVVVGWFGPGDADHPDYGSYWRGALVALDEENAGGGYGGKPFRLVAAWSETPWTAGIVDVTRLVYDRGAWVVIGGVDGATTHLAVQVALKSRFLLLSPGSSDGSADAANVPWLFSIPPSDDAQAPAVIGALGKAATGGPFVVAAANGHDSHATLAAFRRELARRRLTPASLTEFAPERDALAPLAGRLVAARPQAALVVAPPQAAGRLVAELRRQGFLGTVVGGATLGSTAFLHAAGPAAEGVIAASGVEPAPGFPPFASSYERRWREPPDAAAAFGYDAVRLVAAAVRRAGLNRARIRDAVRALSPWNGACGPLRWDARGRNARTVACATWSSGRLR